MKAPSCVLWVELKQFYAEASAKPVVVMREGNVLDANSAARRRGIQGVLSLRQARALLQDGVFKAWEPDAYEKRRRAWLNLCVDFSGVIEPADQHAAWIDLSLHPSPLDVAERLIRVLAQETGLKISYGIAPSKWVAFLSAKHNDCGLAQRDPKAFLAPLPITELLPALPEHRERLRFLGYSTIGEVAELSLPILQAQFGEAALTISSAAIGKLAQKPQASYPVASIAESLVFDGASESSEVIYEACRVLARSIGERLAGQGLQSGKLRVRLEFEDGSLKTLGRTFTKPLRCPRSVASGLHILLEPALIAPIVSISASVPGLEKVRLVQPSLLSGPLSNEQQRVAAALQQVQNAFGSVAVQLGGQIEIPRRVRVLREWKHATGWR